MRVSMSSSPQKAISALQASTVQRSLSLIMTVSLSCSCLRLGLITFCCTDLIVSMTETEYTVSEADGLVSVCVELEQGTLDGETISVFLSTSAGSASPMSKNRTSFSLSLSIYNDFTCYCLVSLS